MALLAGLFVDTSGLAQSNITLRTITMGTNCFMTGIVMVGAVSAVNILLALNECSDAREVESLVKLLGWRSRIPYVCWCAGTLGYIGTTIPLFLYMSLDDIPFFLWTYVPAVVCCLTLHGGVFGIHLITSLYKVKTIHSHAGTFLFSAW